MYNAYEASHEALQNLVDSGFLLIESANKMDETIYDRFIESGEPDIEVTVEAATASIVDSVMNQYYTEAASVGTIKKIRKKLERIKNSQPDEYDENDKVQEFVTKNYEKLMKTCDILEKEPEALRKEEIRYLVVAVLGYIGAFGATVVGGAGIGLVATVMWIVGVVVSCIVTYIRATNDNDALKDLSKIRRKLATVKGKKGLSKGTEMQINKMISRISDVQTEFSAEVRTVKESGVTEKRTILSADEFMEAFASGGKGGDPKEPENPEDEADGDVDDSIEESTDDIVLEQVAELIDRVTVAYEEGIIDEDDAVGMFNLLNLDNYEM